MIFFKFLLIIFHINISFKYIISREYCVPFKYVLIHVVYEMRLPFFYEELNLLGLKRCFIDDYIQVIEIGCFQQIALIYDLLQFDIRY